MASTVDMPPLALKDKLSDVKSLLKTANNRLQDEVSKYEIFTTKTSASSNSNTYQDKRTEIIRTLTDISTLESVLSCPIFDRIVNVTDSLDRLSYQLNLHPSITEFDIDASNGELILAPPVDFISLNNFNGNRAEYSDRMDGSPLAMSPNFAQNNNGNNNITTTTTTTNNNNNNNRATANDRALHQLNSDYFDAANNVNTNNGYAQTYQLVDGRKYDLQNQQTPHQKVQNYRVPSSAVAPPTGAYNTEKLVSNGSGAPRVNGKSALESDDPQVAEATDADQDSIRRQYKSNGHLPRDNGKVRNEFQSTQSMNQVGNRNNEQRRTSCSNDLYKTSHELNQQPHDVAINQNYNQQQQQKQQQQHHQVPRSSEQSHNPQKDAYSNNNPPIANGRLQNNQVAAAVQYNRGSCSPSSAGSTVRLADECDSGASSYQSQNARGSLPPYQMKGGAEGCASAGPDSVEQDLIEELSSADLERIKVTLERDEGMGLGITIAGYTLQDEEISGIFIKSVIPGSAADRCGKIKEFDQIFSVNDRELVDYSNEEAVSLLRQTGKVVTLELMRHSDKLKHNKLKAVLDCAQCPQKSSKNSASLKSSDRPNSTVEDDVAKIGSSPTRSSIPVSKSRDTQNKSPTKPVISPKPKALVQVSTYQEASVRKAQEAIYRNDSHSRSGATPREAREMISPTSPQSQIPIAAQRGGTNKVIETKHGLRNTIDIRPPVCQTATATYVNKLDDLDSSDSTTKQNSIIARLQQEASDEFGRLVPSEEPEWDSKAQIIELPKDKSQGLGFAVKEYANPKHPMQPIIMITSITPGGIADRDGRLAVGDLLIFVDDTNLEGAVLNEAVKALKKTDRHARLGVLKLKRA